jgi:hypothetical protein
MLLSISAGAYTKLAPDSRSFISLHGDLGYSALLNSIEGQQASNGVDARIGIDFRMQYNRFIFSVGAEGMYALYTNHMNKLDVSIPMKDTESDIFNMHVLLNKSRDNAHMVNLNVPLLVGMEWRRVYFMVGPKISLNLYGKTSSSAEITTYGEYERYYSDFYDMPNHQFYSGRKMSSLQMNLDWNLNVMVHAEVGARVGHISKYTGFRHNPDRIRMYVALFMDCGVLDVHQKGKGEPMFGYRETSDGVQFYIQPLMKSDIADQSAFRNLSVGVKFTVAFELPKKGKSYYYDYNKVDRGYIKRGGNQSIQ